MIHAIHDYTCFLALHDYTCTCFNYVISGSLCLTEWLFYLYSGLCTLYPVQHNHVIMTMQIWEMMLNVDCPKAMNPIWHDKVSDLVMKRVSNMVSLCT